jgi:hypothetical protein
MDERRRKKPTFRRQTTSEVMAGPDECFPGRPSENAEWGEMLAIGGEKRWPLVGRNVATDTRSFPSG